MNDFDYIQARSARFIVAKGKVAERLREMADEVDRISVIRTNGDRREPNEIVSSVIATVLSGIPKLRLDLLASRAEDIYGAERYEHEQSGCGYSITDPYRVCALGKGHTLPLDDGLIVHVDSSGVYFA